MKTTEKELKETKKEMSLFDIQIKLLENKIQNMKDQYYKN